MPLNTIILKIVDSKYGKAIITTSYLSKGQRIIDFKGAILTKNQLPKIKKPEDDRFLQIDANKYIGPSHKMDDLINHSCNPNCRVVINKEGAFLESIRPISTGEEICFDYSTTMDEEDWELDCLCGLPQCRGKITDFKKLPKSIQEKYILLNAVPKFIINNL